MTAHAQGFESQDNWIADTGATHHMTPNLSVLENATPYDQDDKIIVSNGEGLPIQHIGHANIPITSSQSLLLPNVLHVPHLSADLLSIYKLCHDNNCIVTFDDVGYCVQDKAIRAVLLKGMSSKGLYHFPKSLPFTSVSSPTAFLGQKINHITWHQRLGHLTNEVLVKMLHSSQIVCSLNSSSICSACLGGKMSRLPSPLMHSTHTSSSSPVPSSHLFLAVVLPIAHAPPTYSDNIPPQLSIPPSLHSSLQDSTSSATPPCPSHYVACPYRCTITSDTPYELFFSY
ncbi:hypothetical protein L3X38_028078 [Prunus dulcis]|uniref:GAG-pre-integrase domain-containing protein n=1 Tax=Prunus dulcis TaxID=3755 RepID=A0AAD4VRD4_PRUDU|nr:hypothetical protein L3X38_028078 [Prunus dulcis]